LLLVSAVVCTFAFMRFFFVFCILALVWWLGAFMHVAL
jgi:hypothetical protein